MSDRLVYESRSWESKFAGQSHYSYALYPDIMADWAGRCAAALPGFLDGRLPIFCYSGMSGVAHATALSLEYYRRHGATFGMVYARKPGEKSHNESEYEHSLKMVDGADARLVFVDDCVDSGATRDHVLRQAMRAIRQLGLGTYGYKINFDGERYCYALKYGIETVAWPEHVHPDYYEEPK